MEREKEGPGVNCMRMHASARFSWGGGGGGGNNSSSTNSFHTSRCGLNLQPSLLSRSIVEAAGP